jgi:hypothetical protein
MLMSNLTKIILFFKHIIINIVAMHLHLKDFVSDEKMLAIVKPTDVYFITK